MLQDVFINENVNSKYSLYSDKNTSYQVQDDGGYYIITKIGKNGETDFEKFFR
jgi:hypothetical protein